MKIIAAGTYFPSLEINAYTHLKDKPYFCERPKASDDDLMVEMALPVCTRVLEEGQTLATELDMILSISISPDHLFRSKDMAAPRLCHPLQRELGANNAFVFDIIDADWSSALEIAEGFMAQLSYQKVLIVRTEVTALSVLPDATSGFDFVDGVGVLLLERTEHQLNTHYLPIAHENIQHAIFKMLPPEEMATGKLKGSFHLAYNPNLVQMLNLRAVQLIDKFMANESQNFEIIVESWMPKHGESLNRWKHLYRHLGAFTLPAFVEEKLRQSRSLGFTDESEELILSITFNPFTMRYGGQLLRIAPNLGNSEVQMISQESIFC
jgi:hypothetical protein